jgi:hypothetical protein
VITDRSTTRIHAPPGGGSSLGCGGGGATMASLYGGGGTDQVWSCSLHDMTARWRSP